MADYIQNVPSELQSMILYKLSSLRDLHALIRASPQFYQVFQAIKQNILFFFLQQTLHPSVLLDSLAAIRASRLEPRTRAKVLEFIHNYRSARKDSPLPYAIPTHDLFALCKFHSTIQYFCQDFVHHANTFLKSHNQSLGLSPPLSGDHIPLSLIEKGRLQRAFYRFDLYGSLFRDDKWGEPVVYESEQASKFLSLYTAWEIEQLACVRDYMLVRLTEVFDNAENVALGKALDAPPNPHGIWGQNSKKDHPKTMEFHISLGLVHLRQLFQSADTERLGIIEKYMWRTNIGFLSVTLLGPATDCGPATRRVHQSERRAVPVSDTRLLDLGSDSIDGQNECYRWFNNRQRPEYCESRADGLRLAGYVFWDGERMKAFGCPGAVMRVTKFRIAAERWNQAWKTVFNHLTRPTTKHFTVERFDRRSRRQDIRLATVQSGKDSAG